MKSRAIIVAFHKYTPFGDQYYEPIAEFFFSQMKKYQNEYDAIHVVDSNWNFDVAREIKKLGDFGAKITVHNVSPHLRYYDAYKEILPQIEEDLVLFMDNDFLVYKPEVINKTFSILEGRYEKRDVVSIYDTCGEYKTDKLNGKNKFCPYFFATRKELLMQYRDVEWGPNMPEHETLGKLTEKMLGNGVQPYEMEEDKSNFLIGMHAEGPHKSKDLGYYHIRAGSTPAYLLAHRERGDVQYFDYLKNQPRSEYLRQFAWYWWMVTETGNMEVGRTITEALDDMNIKPYEWTTYIDAFIDYHGL